jgi:hypothetical protein
LLAVIPSIVFAGLDQLPMAAGCLIWLDFESFLGKIAVKF